MLRKTIPNILFLVTVNLLVKPIWIFGIDRVVQNQLGEATYGLYFALFNFSMFFQILNDFGIQNYNSRHIAREPGSLDQYLTSLISAKFGLSLIYILVSVIIFQLLGYHWAEQGRILILLLLNQILISGIFYLRSNLAGLHKFKLDTFFSVFDKILMIAFVGSMLYVNVLHIRLTIYNFILAQTIAFGLNALILLFVVASLARVRSFSLNKALVIKVLRESIPFATSIFLMSIYLRMDTIMIERLLKSDGAYAAGIYAQSFRIIDALNMIGILFANILLPTYARALQEKRPVGRLVRSASAWMACIVFPAILLVLLKGQYIIDLLYIHHPTESGRILTVLIFSFAAYSFMHIYSSLLTAAGKLRRLNIIFAIGIVLNLATNLALIPRLGALGAAITTSCSQGLILLLILVQTRNFMRSGYRA
jgi:O-antigen/teichoic acid export membrane protein